MLYSGSSDRTVRVWEADGVYDYIMLDDEMRPLTSDIDLQGKLLYTLKDHAHWVTTLALNTDFVLRTGPYDHTPKKPASEAEGNYYLLSHCRPHHR